MNLNTLDEDKHRADTSGLSHCERSQLKLIYDKNYCGFEDKFTSSVLYVSHKGGKENWEVIDDNIHQLWQSQVDFRFGFVPLQQQLLPGPDIDTTKISSDT